jgi:hypothetical protein
VRTRNARAKNVFGRSCLLYRLADSFAFPYLSKQNRSEVGSPLYGGRLPQAG